MGEIFLGFLGYLRTQYTFLVRKMCSHLLMEKNITLIRNKSLVLDEIILQNFGTFLEYY